VHGFFWRSVSLLSGTVTVYVITPRIPTNPMEVAKFEKL